VNRRTILLASAAMLAWLPAVGAAAAEPQASPATFYVAPNGNDGWSGAKPAPVGSDGPLATLQATRDAARRAGAAAVRRIVVQAGTYTLGSALTLDARDSGLTIEAAPGAKATLCGGRRLTDWQRDGDRFWSVSVPDVAAGRWDFRVLVVNGRMAPRARLPQTGRFKHLSEFRVRWMSSTGGGWQRKPTPEELTTLRYRLEDLEPWLDPRNAEITVYHMWDESLVGVASVDRQAHTLTFSKPSSHPPGAFGVKDYVVWNVREGMTEPGQWYLDRAAGKVVYWPLPGEDLTRTEAWAPAVESLIRLEGKKGAPVRAVTIRGLSLTVTGIPLAPGGFGAGKYEGAVTLSETEDCCLADLAVFHVGGQGVKASNSVNLHVENCDVHHTGAGGIVVRGKGLVVADNLVHDVGLICPSGIGIFGGGPQSLVAHNEVHDTSYSAVNFSGEDVRIESNLIYRAMRVLHDGAGIYSFSPRRLVMRGNFIRDIPDTGGYGASAYYLDERAEDCLVEGNLAFGVARPSHNHMAVRNTIRNNFFVAAGDAKITFPRSSEFTFEKNVVAAGGKITFTNPAAMSTFKDNVLWSGVGKIEGVALRDYAAAGAEAMAVPGADPKLLPGVEKGVCRFAPDSPALKLGIRPIDVSGAGRRTPPSPAPATAKVDRSSSKAEVRALMVTGVDYPGHKWRETAPVLRKAIEKDGQLAVDVVEDPAWLASGALNGYKVLIHHWMNWEVPAPGTEARENFARFVRDGGGLVLVHFACGAWQDWPEFERIAGRVWNPKLRGHDPHGSFTVEIVDTEHPITRGMQSFETADELYTCLDGETPVHVLAKATSKVDKKDYPIAFVLTYGKGRVFHCVLGHDVRAFEAPEVVELFRRGTAWAAGLEPTPGNGGREPSASTRSMTKLAGEPAGSFPLWIEP